MGRTALRRTGPLESPPNDALDRLARVAALTLGAPVGLVCLLDADRQFLAGAAGLAEPLAPARWTPVSRSLAQLVVADQAPLVVADARRDPRVRDHPAVRELDVAAYAGFPLRAPDGEPLGALCVHDSVPRTWEPSQLAVLAELADAASWEIARPTGAILDTATEAYVSIDAAGRVAAWNPAAERTFGWGRAEAIGRPLAELIVPERLRAAHISAMRRLAAGDQGTLLGRRLELPAMHRDGHELPVELTISRTGPGQAGTFHAFVRDITDRRRAERYAATQHAVSAALAGAAGVADGVARVLRAIGEGLGWDFAVLWNVEADGERLVHAGSWSAGHRDLAVFDAACRARGFTWAEGVPGRAWADDEALWVEDVLEDEGFLRAAEARACGLRGAICLPVHSAGAVLGLLECFSSVPMRPDPALLDLARSMARQIGLFIQRRRADELALALSTTRRDLDRVVGRVNDYLFTVELFDDGTARSVFASPNGQGVFGGQLDLRRELNAQFEGLIHPEDRELFAGFEAAVNGGQAAEVECRLVGFDDETRWVWIRVQPRREDGHLYLDGLCTNVTERRRLSDELRESRTLLQAILDTSEVVVFVKDLDGRYLFVNETFDRQYSAEGQTAQGKTDFDLFPAEIAAELRANDGLVLQRGTQVQTEERVTMADGVRIYLSTKFPLDDSAGQIRAVGGVAIEITDRKEAEARRERLLEQEREQVERLQELDRMKTEFVSIASHELRTPITSIAGYSEVLLEAGHSLDETQRRFLGIIDRNARRLSNLVGALLDLSKADSGRLDLEQAPVDLSTVARDAVEAIGRAVEAKKLELNTAVAPELVVVGDESRLRQVIDNLLTNAVKYTPDGGQVATTVRLDGHDVVLEVADTGVGIPEHERARLFERFFRASTATESSIPGTGLGLAVAKSIVEAHGGTIAVAGRDGPGSVFVVRIPAADPPD